MRIISPARSLAIISKESIALAKKRLEELGLKVTFSKHSSEHDVFDSSSIKSRIEDLHDAFRDKNVKAILTTLGGYNSNQLLKYIDYDLIKKNPKIFCGFSDITAMQWAIYAKTGLITYYGPHFSSFGMKKGFEYTTEYFKKCLFEDKEMKIIPSKEWSDDQWYIDQDKREFMKNNGPYPINGGDSKKIQGVLIGGNLCTFNLLQGTEFMPQLKNSILFIEDDEESNSNLFDRDLQSLLHQPQFKDIKGIVIGRFQKASKMNREVLTAIIKTKKELEKIPVIADVDFGHTTPIMTFPIGGKVELINTEITIVDH